MIHEAIYCKTLVELATDFVEGALDEQTQTDMEVHLATCAGCIAYLGQYRLSVDLVGRLEDEVEPGEQELDTLLQAFRANRGTDGE